jgi:hypothetical protein
MISYDDKKSAFASSEVHLKKISRRRPAHHKMIEPFFSSEAVCVVYECDINATLIRCVVMHDCISTSEWCEILFKFIHNILVFDFTNTEKIWPPAAIHPTYDRGELYDLSIKKVLCPSSNGVTYRTFDLITTTLRRRALYIK